MVLTIPHKPCCSNSRSDGNTHSSVGVNAVAVQFEQTMAGKSGDRSSAKRWLTNWSGRCLAFKGWKGGVKTSVHPFEDQAANLPAKGGMMSAKSEKTRGDAYRSGGHSSYPETSQTFGGAWRSHGQAAASSAPDDSATPWNSGRPSGPWCDNPGSPGTPCSLVAGPDSWVPEPKTRHTRRNTGQEINSIPRFSYKAEAMIGFGKVIKRFRRESGLTQRALAHMVGVTSTYISRLENGQAEPSIALVRRIARAMRIPPEVFFWEAVEIPAGISSADRRACTLAKRVVHRWIEAAKRSSP